jgi:hypothetical protein
MLDEGIHRLHHHHRLMAEIFKRLDKVEAQSGDWFRRVFLAGQFAFSFWVMKLTVSFGGQPLQGVGVVIASYSNLVRKLDLDFVEARVLPFIFPA